MKLLLNRFKEKAVAITAALVLLVFVVPWLDFSPAPSRPLKSVWINPAVLLLGVIIITVFIGLRILEEEERRRI